MRNSQPGPTSTQRFALAGACSLLALATLVGCGLGTGPDQPTSLGTAPSSATTVGLITPSPSPTPSSTSKPKPARTPTNSAHGNGDSAGAHQPATAGGGICADLSAAAVGGAIGSTVTGTAIPGGGCTFAQKNSSSPAASFVETSFRATPGGMTGAKNNATSAVEGTPEDLTGIGDAAFVVTGTEFGGDQTQGAGAVHVGNRLISVTLSQSAGLSAPQVRALVVKLLRFAAAKLS